MTPPTPVMISVITIDSGSSQNAMSSFIPPMFIHTHRSSSMKRCSGSSPIILTKPATAIANAPRTTPQPIRPMTRLPRLRWIQEPKRKLTAAPISGSSMIQCMKLTGSGFSMT